MSSNDPFAHNPFAAPDAASYAIDQQSQGQPVPAGFLTRFAAAFLDGILLNIASFAAGMSIGMIMGASNAAQAVAQIASVLMGWLYAAFMESSDSQGTLGKMAVGIRVTDMNGQKVSFGRATGRHFAKIPSALILMIGFLMPLWTARKQALHDIMAGCVVVKK